MKGHGLILILFVSVSCDNHSDYFESMDTPPVLELLGPAVKHGSFLRDSLKTKHDYLVSFKAVTSSPVAFTFNNSANYSILIDQQVIQIHGIAVSENLIYVTIKDVYLKQYSDTIHLTIFDNLPPIAILNYDITEFDNSYTLSLDGSSSFDKDQRFGGSISSYDFTVNGQHYTSSSSKLMYSVNKGQTYTIHLRVQDNDNAWSNELVTYIQI